MAFERKPKGLNIILVGCGKVGRYLTEQLVKEGHDVTVVDTLAERVTEVTNFFDIMGIVGNGASYSIQMEAGIEEADLIIAVTGSDELNLLCCTVAKQVGNCAAIARVRNPEYSKEVGYLQEKLGLTMIINPELQAAREALRVLAMPMALEVNSFAHGMAEMIKIKLEGDHPLDNVSISEFGKKLAMKDPELANNLLICTVERNGEVTIPSGDFVLHCGDIISFVGTHKVIKTAMKRMGYRTGQVKDCLIVGGGKAAYYLGKGLLESGVMVKIIEKDKARCEELSVLLPKAIIINGDGTDEELLKAEGIQYAESFVPLTGIDEENIMLTLHAKKVSKAKIITKLNRTNFKDVISGLDLGSVIYPKFITAEAIIAYVRAKKNSMDSSNIETLYHMYDGQVESIEFRAENKCTITDVPLMDLNLKKGLLISFINRKGKIIIPSGKDSIQMGDTVMIVTTHTGLHDIKDILL